MELRKIILKRNIHFFGVSVVFKKEYIGIRDEIVMVLSLLLRDCEGLYLN
jgi:hypothetical protein